jgi:recombination protein RecA
MARPKKAQPLDGLAKVEKENKNSTATENLMKFIKSVETSGMLGDINKKIDFIPTGSWIVNRLIGDGTGLGKAGGIPRGFITELFGDESCGKTTLALHVVKEAQAFGPVIYADFEHSLRAQQHYIKNLGVNLDRTKFIHLEPNNFEDGAAQIGKSLLMVKPPLVVIDSLSAMIPKAMIEGDADKVAQIGKQAMLTSNFLNWITKYLGKYNTALLIINQKRNVIKTDKYEPGPNETTSGGKAMRFYASIRIDMKVKERDAIEVDNNLTGIKEKKIVNQNVKVIIVKSKIDLPWRSGPIYIKFGQGIDNVMSILDLAVNRNVVKKNGSSFEYVDKDNPALSFKTIGKQAAWKKLVENSAIIESITPKLMLDTVTDEEKKQMVEEGELDSEDLETEESAALKELEKGMTMESADSKNGLDDQLG